MTCAKTLSATSGKYLFGEQYAKQTFLATFDSYASTALLPPRYLQGNIFTMFRNNDPNKHNKTNNIN
eukprot:910640-Amphidinium_carterae.1